MMEGCRALMTPRNLRRNANNNATVTNTQANE
jgi:hypothetical protein